MKNTTTSLPTSSKKTKKKQALKTPELRFIEFEDNYEETFLKNIVKIPKKEKITSVDDKKLLTVKLHAKGIEINEGVVPKLSKKGRPYYIRNANEILIGRQNFHNGGIGIVPEELDGGICSNAITSFINNRNIVSIKFLFYYLSRSSYYKRSEKYVGGTGQKEFSEKILLDLKIKIPSLEEQEKISYFLSRIDKKLFLMEQRFIQLNKCKLSMLQGMIVKSAYDKEVPNIRFNEFKHKWTTIKLKEITDRITTKNRNLDSNLVLTISAEYGLIDQEKYFNKSVASKNLKNYYLLEKGDFAYNKSYSNGHPYGVVKKLNQYNKGIVSTLYICFKPKHFINPNFLEQYFKTSVWNKEIYKIATEGARNHGLLNIGVEDFFNTKHKIPPTYKEQEKIASFLSTIDDKIKITKKKIDLMKTYKQGLVQKMFV